MKNMNRENEKLPSGITRQQFMAYTLVSGEHDGHTTKEAAGIMEITQRSVERLLKRMEKILPDLFPLLTKDEAAVYSHFQFDREKPNFSFDKMGYIMRCLHKKGKLDGGKPPRIVAYNPGMDNKIVEKF